MRATMRRTLTQARRPRYRALNKISANFGAAIEGVAHFRGMDFAAT